MQRISGALRPLARSAVPSSPTPPCVKFIITPSLRSPRRLASTTPSPGNDPNPILSELQRRGATSPSSSTTSGPHLGPFPLPSAEERQARIDASSRQWSQLGVAQRAGVVATQGASFVVVLGGAGLFALVLWSFTSELFSEASPTRVFEDCIERVEKDRELHTILAPPYSFHGPSSPNENARLRRNRRPSHTLTVDPSTGLETLYVRFAITASDPLQEEQRRRTAADPDAPWTLDNMLDWAKRWIGPVIWDDSHHPGAYNPVLSHGRTEAEEEARLERERERQVQLEKERRRGETYLGRVQNQVGKWVGSAVAGATAGIGGFRKAAAPGGGSNEGAGSYFRRPRKPAYGEYISAEVVAELQKDPNTGHFVYKQLFAAIPDTRASNYYRHDIPTSVVVPPSPDQDGQPQQQPNRWRFWNRQKTVAG
ncbi:hypothetical protein JCM8202_001460 [Rhodotorula sphaerocarpa]